MLVVANLLAAIINTILATIVALRYGRTHAGQSFVAVVVALLCLLVGNTIRSTSVNESVIYMVSIGVAFVLSCLPLALLLFFAALYAPEWWDRRRTLMLICMPYLTGGLAVVLDGLLGTGWLIAGVTLVDHTFARTVPGPYTRWLMTFFALGWLPHMALLGLTLVRVPNERRSMLILGGVLLACVVIGILAPLVPGFQAVSGVITQLLMVSVFSYLLVGRRVFDTTKVAIEQALESTSEAVIVLGLNEQVLYANQAADTLLEVKSRHRRGGAAPLLDVPALRSLIQHKHGEQMLEIRGRTVVVSSNPITTAANDLQGYLLQVRDITDAHASHLALQQREHDLRQTITALEQAQDSQQRLTTTIRGLTLPMIPVMDGVIVVPLIGEFDHQRAIEFSQQLLCGIEAQRARTVVLDLTGMSLMDQRMAQMLMDVVNAARLLGAATTLVGIRPDIAQAIVALGNEFGRLDTAASLHAALTTRSLPGRITSR